MRARLDENGGHVAVAGGDSAAVVDLDQIAVATVVPAGAEHGAVGGRVDRRAVGGGKIDSRVHCGAGVKRVGADAEGAAEFDVGFDRLVGWDRDHAVLQLVELLPAVEQGLEAGVANTLEGAAPTGTRLHRIETEAFERRRIEVLAL